MASSIKCMMDAIIRMEHCLSDILSFLLIQHCVPLSLDRLFTFRGAFKGSPSLNFVLSATLNCLD